MIELTNNSAFDNVNVPFKLFWEQRNGVDWTISTEKGFRQLLIIDEIGNIAAEITIPHKMKRELTVDLLLGQTILSLPTTFDGGVTTLSYKVHKHREGGYSLWEEILETYKI